MSTCAWARLAGKGVLEGVRKRRCVGCFHVFIQCSVTHHRQREREYKTIKVGMCIDRIAGVLR